MSEGQGEETVLCEMKGDVAVVTLNRPKALNAMTRELLARLEALLADLERGRKARAVLLTGAGRGFCAGQDLTIGETMEGTAIRELIEDHYLPVFQRIRTLPMPVVVAVNGVAAGGGCSLALTGDVTFAAESASFVQVFSRIGITPDLGSTYLLPRLVGRQRALAMMMTNEPVSAREAAEWGMIYRAVPDENLMEEALAFAAKLAAGPTLALALTRRSVDQAENHTFDEQFRYEAAVQIEALASDDAKEAVAAFVEKRKARFTGR